MTETDYKLENRFSPLSECLYLNSDIDFDNFERDSGLEQGTYRQLAAKVRSEDYSFYSIEPGINMLLNRSVPSFPAMPPTSGSRRERPAPTAGTSGTDDGTEALDTAAERKRRGARDGGNGSVSSDAKRKRRDHILDRIVKRFSNSNHPPACYLQWCSVSPATLPWKRAVYDKLFGDKPLYICDCIFSREFVLGLCAMYSSRFSTCQTSSKIAAKLAPAIASLRAGANCELSLSPEENMLFSDDNLSDSRNSCLWSVGDTDTIRRFNTWINTLITKRNE